MITISVCMIVKDEEAVLARCLDTLKGIADEIIIVDTGSSDSTKQIAACYTDKIYDFPWVHDFSAARNYSLSKASMDYIYVADADEVLDDDNRKRFLSLKEHLPQEVEIVQMKYANQLAFNTTYNYDIEYRPKLYKRLRSLRFVDPVHESVALEPCVYDSDITILHMPQSNHAARDFDTFQRAIKRDGRLSPKLFEMYARELFIAGEEKDFLDAFSFFKDFAVREDYTERERKICDCVLVRCYHYMKDITGLLKYGLKNIADGKASSEVCYELGEFFFKQNDYKEATIWFYNAAYETECELNLRFSGEYPLKRLTECYRLLGNKEQEEAYQALYDAWCKENMR
ncbi:glycosyltransferase family 2 protein [Mobilitalea sibirica]|uniref:Glycosyltransferase family 2 protein n=1 Tax=Mobilitalea sibirica TaxID=1462919 RepID=A0A8J7H1D4_9FIRM|nr:glycosyltransferase family 2 protein [Mobilitalea sibirica]MBH1942549.1 glycosyltransferase family 2 protein [Mobilitalea sibirica]